MPDALSILRLIRADALFSSSTDALRVRALVAGLPRLQRDIVMRRFWGPDSIAEIAEAVGLDFDDVLCLLKMALAKLAAELTPVAVFREAASRPRLS